MPNYIGGVRQPTPSEIADHVYIAVFEGKGSAVGLFVSDDQPLANIEDLPNLLTPRPAVFSKSAPADIDCTLRHCRSSWALKPTEYFKTLSYKELESLYKNSRSLKHV